MACTDHATLSGAVRTAPRWSAEGRRGRPGTARGEQLPAARARRRGDHRADEEEQPGRGKKQSQVVDVSPRVERGRHHDGDDDDREHGDPAAARLRDGPRRAATRSATSAATWPTGPGGRPTAGRGTATSASGGCSCTAVTTTSCGTTARLRHRSGRRRRSALPPDLRAARPPPRTPAPRARAGGSRRGRRTRPAAARGSTSMVASTPSGSTPSKGSSSSSTSGSWNAASTTDIRRPMPWQKPAVTRSATPPRSNRSSRSRGAALPAGRQPRNRGRELQVLPRRGPRDQAADVRAVADPRLRTRRVPRGRRCRRPVTWPAVGGGTPASTRRVVDLPAPLRPTRATEPPAGTSGRSRRPRSTVPNCTVRSRTSTGARHAIPSSPTTAWRCPTGRPAVAASDLRVQARRPRRRTPSSRRRA